MALNKNALLEYEAGQNPQGKVSMINSGDAKKFTTNLSPWSKKSGMEFDVKPDGLATGGAVTAAVSGSNDVVDVAALTCYLLGVKISVSAGVDTAISRAATNVASISSITINSGGSIAVVKGTDSADATFSETRGAAGGPPFIPVGSIEVAQVRTASNTAAPIASSEIYSVVGTHTEKSDFPGWDEDPANGAVNFDSALPLSHTGSLPKNVTIDFSTPIFAPLSIAGDFKPSANSHSVSSESYYNNKTQGAVTTSLGQGSFIAKLNDGITDALAKLANETLWFRFFPNKNKAPHILDQGILGIDQDFGATDHPTASCTISAEAEHIKVES